MNGQLHVITAKYIDFNTRINNFLHDFRVINSTKCDKGKYFDDDTTDYMVNLDKTNECNSTTNKSYNSSGKYGTVVAMDETNRYRDQLRILHNGKQRKNFSQLYDVDAYDSIQFKYSLDQSLRKRDFVNRVNIDVINSHRLDVSVHELQSLTQLKFNNIFVNICKFNNIITTRIKWQNGIVSSVEFIILFDEPINHICLKKFSGQSMSELSIRFVSYEKLLHLKYFRFSKDKQKSK